MTTYTVGQTVFVVRTRGIGNAEVITKVGRKWAELGSRNDRFEIATGLLDGGEYSSPGTVWSSEDEYEAYVGLVSMWARFRLVVSESYSPPNGVTEEQIKKCAKVLGLDKKAEV